MKLTIELIEIYFDAFNKEIFNNKLVRNFPCKVSTARHTGGYIVLRKIDRKVTKFFISKCFTVDRLALEDIILHEMVHVFIAQMGIEDDSAHGWSFRRKVKEINEKFNRNIGYKYVPKDIKKTIYNKKIGIIYIIDKGIVTFSTNLDLEYIKEVYSTRGFKFKIGFINHPDMEGYKVFNKKSVYNCYRSYPISEHIKTIVLPNTNFIN